MEIILYTLNGREIAVCPPDPEPVDFDSWWLGRGETAHAALLDARAACDWQAYACHYSHSCPTCAGRNMPCAWAPETPAQREDRQKWERIIMGKTGEEILAEKEEALAADLKALTAIVSMPFPPIQCGRCWITGKTPSWSPYLQANNRTGWLCPPCAEATTGDTR